MVVGAAGFLIQQISWSLNIVEWSVHQVQVLECASYYLLARVGYGGYLRLAICPI